MGKLQIELNLMNQKLIGCIDENGLKYNLSQCLELVRNMLEVVDEAMFIGALYAAALPENRNLYTEEELRCLGDIREAIVELRQRETICHNFNTPIYEVKDSAVGIQQNAITECDRKKELKRDSLVREYVDLMYNINIDVYRDLLSKLEMENPELLRERNWALIHYILQCQEKVNFEEAGRKFNLSGVRVSQVYKSLYRFLIERSSYYDKYRVSEDGSAYLSSIGISVRARNALARREVYSIQDFRNMDIEDLNSLKSIGKATILEVAKKIADFEREKM